ncbi:hypothetical protein GWG65_34430 [Bradyrhizobium sp. CSA207]|uniref:hypothetical protein n=1 Tax=Bradyrhizobium sp. CSA207 TaxID=2698826 RepID=UPI0023B10B5B|nr:hypothetical protein [Bradyrhizobium sp. CSA207]MDE5446372.1 hypothetical protein [Bradyrhizobium sp. CSA207]
MFDHFAAPARLSKGHQAACSGSATIGDLFVFHNRVDDRTGTSFAGVYQGAIALL